MVEFPNIETIDWINPKEDVPDVDITVLVYDDDGDVGVAVYDDETGRWEGPTGYSYRVVAWAHMPIGPEGGLR